MRNATVRQFITEVNGLGEQAEPLMQAVLSVWKALPQEDKEAIADKARGLTSIRNCGVATALEVYAALCCVVYEEAKGKNGLFLEQQFGALIFDERSKK